MNSISCLEVTWVLSLIVYSFVQNGCCRCVRLQRYAQNHLIFRLHTWVGYDVDGRGDISWSNTFSKRLKVKLEQLLQYEKSIQSIFGI